MTKKGLHPPLPQDIGTDRLVLTAVRQSDAVEQSAVVADSIAELRLWMDWAQALPTFTQSTADLAEAAAEFAAGQEFNWSIRKRSDSSFIGRVGLFVRDFAVPKGEIGYWVSSAETENGYASEAARAVLETALGYGFRRVEIRCDSRNLRSARVAQSVDMTLEAVLRNDRVDLVDQTKVRDTLLFCAVR